MPFVVLSMGKRISVMMVSGMNAASSAIAKLAVYPRSKCSLHGSAISMDPLVSWMMVRVLRVMLFRRSGLPCVRVRILSNIIMLWRSEGLTMRVVVFGCVKAKWMAFVAIVVVLPVCLPMQAMMRCSGSFRSFSW